MKAVDLYESLWGIRTASVARAIAEGIAAQIGASAGALSTAEATAGVDLVVAGSPVPSFKLPSERVRESLRVQSADAPSPVFDTQIRGPFGSAAPAIGKALEHDGYRSIAKPVGLIVAGKYGLLRDGELERGREW